MLPKSWELLDIEIGGLRRHVDCGRSLLEKVKQAEPSALEVLALSGFMYGFYGGVERAMDIIGRGMGEISTGVSEDMQWRRRLLETMSLHTGKRPCLLTTDLRDDLSMYLAFHHAFEDAYWQDMKWEKIRPLVLGLLRAFEKFLAAVETFRAAMVSRAPEGKD
jgi:hypothetical protein